MWELGGLDGQPARESTPRPVPALGVRTRRATPRVGALLGLRVMRFRHLNRMHASLQGPDPIDFRAPADPAEPAPPPIREPDPPENPDLPIREPEPDEPGEI
jgi:hypothetical protein